MDLNEVQKLEKVFENYRGIILQFIELKKVVINFYLSIYLECHGGYELEKS